MEGKIKFRCFIIIIILSNISRYNLPSLEQNFFYYFESRKKWNTKNIFRV